jgi:hypothetical protein
VSDNIGIRTYLEYTMEQESPALYHLSVCLSITAGVLGRRVWVAPAPEGKVAAPIYPNIYVVLVGPTSKLHKSSCCKKGKVLIENIPDVHLLHTDITVEQLIVYLSETPIVFIYAPELAITLGKQAFQGKLPVYLTAYYDGDNPSYATKTAGIYELEPPSVNILGGSTRSWLRTGLTEEKGTSGYSARFLYVVVDRTERRSTGDYDVPEQKEQMIQILDSINYLAGEFKVAPDVWKWYEAWYMKFADMLQETTDDFILGYLGRKPAHIWKLAMCFAALRQSSTINMQDVLDAKQYMEWLEPTIDQVYSPKEGNPHAGLQDSILDLVAKEEKLALAIMQDALFNQAEPAVVEETVRMLVRAGRLVQNKLATVQLGPRADEGKALPPRENDILGRFGLKYKVKGVK